MAKGTSGPVRVYYVTPGGINARGGMGGVARNLTAAFQKMEQPPVVTVLDAYGEGGAKMPFYFAATLLRLIWGCVTRSVDIIHLHMSHKGSALRKLFLLRIAALFGVPAILHIHGSEFAVFGNSLSPAMRRLLVSSMDKASCIIVLGERWKRYLVDVLDLPEAKVAIVANGVPVMPLPSRAVSPVCRLLVLGLVGPRKGTPDLLRALAMPEVKALPWRCLIAGNGEVEKYRAEAASLGVSDRVDMPGWIDPSNVKDLLAEADIFILPSHNEGLPVAILEAMASGLPVITTSVGAIPELVLQNETGLIVSPGDSEALAKAIAELVSNAERRAAFGAKGRVRIERHYSIETIAGQVKLLYDRLSGRV